MKKYLYLLFAMYVTLVTVLHADSVEATVNTQEVIKGNPVQLRIKAIGSSAAFPDIDTINGIEVRSSGTSRQSSMKITSNGMESETSTVKKYMFVPKEDMVIPSYTVRIGKQNYKTKPIQIRVVESQAPKVQKSGKFDFQLKTDKNVVSVGESFVVTLYISIDNSLKGIQITDYVAPTAPDFFIKELEGQKEYAHNGYSVIEKQYIFTAKKEGNYTISPAAAKLGQPDWSRQDIFGRAGVSWMPIASNPLKIEVKPLNTNADLVGEFTLDARLDTQHVKPNKPVNLKITIKGKGNLEDFEFPEYEIDGVTVYSDEAKVETGLEKNELVSTYTKSFAFISESDFSIPSRSISVYDPKTQKTTMLEVPGYDIKVEGSSAPAKATNVPAKVHTKDQGLQAPKVIEKTVQVEHIAWWMLALAFVLGAVFVYLLQMMIPMLKGAKTYNKESDALKILYAHMSEDKAVEEMVRKLYAKKRGDKSVVIDKKELKAMLERFRQ